MNYQSAHLCWSQVNFSLAQMFENFGSTFIISFSEDLKIAMAAEANAWKVMYGRKMNTEYLTLMENVMEQIEDLSRRLSRPIKDLDDVRQAMATLKEIREKEIYIDSCLGPVEVGTDPLDHIGMSECMSSIKI